MAAPKAKTLQQKLGFFDEDLKKPMHDDILKWVDRNAIQVIYSIYPNLRNWSNDKVAELKKYCEDCIERTKKVLTTKIEEREKEIISIKENIKYYEERFSNGDEYYQDRFTEENKKKNILLTELNQYKDKLITLDSKLLLGELPIRDTIKVLEKPWEYPVTSQSHSSTGYVSSKNIIGFIDIKITISYTQLSITGIDFENRIVNNEIKWTQTTKNINYNRNYIDGENIHSIYLEIKTQIPSLGELFRQLRMYQEYIKGDFVIVCPDSNEKELIEEQGYKFIKYE